MKLIRKIVLIFSLFAVLLVLLMLTPRLWSALNSSKPPVGYFFLPPTNLALYSGLESLADKAVYSSSELDLVKDVEYKNWDGKPLYLDFYHLKNSSGRPPLLLFVHGGAWAHGDRNEYMGYAIHFAQLGYATATVEYRLAPKYPFPACAEDLSDAVSFIAAHGEEFRYDPGKVALIGGSAGAHLAMLTAYGWKNRLEKSDSTHDLLNSKRIRAVVDLYGPTDLTTPYAREQSMVTRLMNKSYRESPQIYREASPIFWVSKESPPTLILHGTSDKLVPISQAEILQQKLDSLGVPVDYRPFPGWPHTMDLGKRVQSYCSKSMEEFFKIYLK